MGPKLFEAGLWAPLFSQSFCFCLLLPSGKILIIGGSIANFTNVAATFKVRDSPGACCQQPLGQHPGRQPLGWWGRVRRGQLPWLCCRAS